MTGPDPAALAAVLARAGGDAALASITALSGGASSATYAVDAARDGAPWPLIVQCAATADGAGAITKATQAALQRIAAAHGLPVAAVVAVFEPGDGLGDGFAMTRVAGESLAPRYLRLPEYAAARAAMTAQCGAALARLHAVPLRETAALPLPGGTDAEQLDRLFALYRSYRADLPAFDLAFAWLRRRLPGTPATALVHGDFRSGNFIVDSHGLAAVLDWELAHLGDPLEDLAWLCVNAWRFGNWRLPVGGFGQRDALYAAYEAAGGAAVDPVRAHVWEVHGTLRWGMACLQLVDDHLSGRVPSVERAAIGRRISETEVDLLYLIRHGSI